MKQIIIWASVFLVGSVLATLMLYDNGKVSMVWGDWVLETSLSFLLALTVVGFLVGYVAVRVLGAVWRLPKTWQQRRQVNRNNRAQSTMAKGMIALEYGDWQTAEKELIKSAKLSEAGLIHYLSAAKMAHNQTAYERRDRYLTQAREAYPAEYATIGLVEARLLSEHQPKLALTILEALHQQQPKHGVILAELAHTLRQQGDWPRLEALLPKIRKTRALEPSALEAIEQQLLAGKIATAHTVEVLDVLWGELSIKQRAMPDVLAEFVEQRMGWGKENGLAALIEQVLKRQWSDRLVYQYGRITLGPAFERLKIAEKWLKEHEQNPVLLLTLGRLASSSQLWGLGQSYLKQSLILSPQIETFHALAQCYEAEGKDSQAALTYKEAILQLEKKS
ncbi:heme biosynthesis HemY N-terminal domain-containing protein [Thiomicrorhabdus aquaedulcis]|uniref:heme biosynthesis HemY N-terminal domain-containing protein n=1 Tax=Thiomicrorhabdus aquaedulcis TaxID=2211106 RepID=UPI000FD6D707|nr:heme biosynthesis HemY N-terminal domain-containing protein [Thiomicrorhabdus aquaedulcis]